MKSKSGDESDRSRTSNARSEGLRNVAKMIMDTNHQEFYQKRIPKIKDLFRSRKLLFSDYVFKDKILSVLDELCGQKFDRKISEQLFDKLVPQVSLPGSPPAYLLQDFVETHIKAEFLLLNKMGEVSLELDRIEREIETLERQLIKVKKNPKVEPSSLEMTIVEAVCDDDGYSARVGSRYTVIALCQGYKFETEEITLETEYFNPVFDQTFHIGINGKDDVVQVSLRDMDRYSSEDDYEEMKCTITLESYEDMMEYDSWFTLFNRGQPTKFKVHAMLKCNLSKLLYIEERLRSLVEQRDEVAADREDLEENIRALVFPFAFSGGN